MVRSSPYGRLVAGADLRVLPSWDLQSHRDVFGQDGRAQGRSPLLVEHFVDRAASDTKLEFVMDPSSQQVRSSFTVRFMSPGDLVAAMPTFAHLQPDAVACGQAMVASQYLLSDEFWQYHIYVARVKEAFGLLSRMGGPEVQPMLMREFLVLERDLRLRQFKLGVPWDEAFDDLMFTSVVCRLHIRLHGSQPPGGVLPPPQGGGGAKQAKGAAKQAKGAAGGAPKAGGGAPGAHCWAFDRDSVCKHGDACKYAAHHSCILCQAVSHGVYHCPELAKRAAAPAAAAP